MYVGIAQTYNVCQCKNCDYDEQHDNISLLLVFLWPTSIDSFRPSINNLTSAFRINESVHLCCRIDATGVIKVADFGLAEDIYTKNYYRRRKSDTSEKLPVRWMSPESIQDGMFTEKSDVVREYVWTTYYKCC